MKHFNKIQHEYMKHLVLIQKEFVKSARKCDEQKTVTCKSCDKSVDYCRQPEISMGAIKCPHCGSIIDQSGKSHTKYTS